MEICYSQFAFNFKNSIKIFPFIISEFKLPFIYIILILRTF